MENVGELGSSPVAEYARMLNDHYSEQKKLAANHDAFKSEESPDPQTLLVDELIQNGNNGSVGMTGKAEYFSGGS
mgnify:FL=1